MFNLGFEKIADNAATGGTNNQGLPFNSTDNTNTTSNVGPGGMTEPGPKSYEPTPKKTESSGKGQKKMTPNEIGEFFMRKGAGVLNRKMDNGTSEENWTNGHKYESSTPDATHEDVVSKSAAEKNRRKAYVRASLK